MSPTEAAAFRVPESGMGRAESKKEANLPCNGSALALQGEKKAQMDVLTCGAQCVLGFLLGSCVSHFPGNIWGRGSVSDHIDQF